MAEALLSQRARAANSSQRDEDLEHQCASYESENKHLRERVRIAGTSILYRITYDLVQLQDSHLRFSALESELNKLKPLLLMQPSFPFINTSSQRQSTLQISHSVDPGSSKLGQETAGSTPIEELEKNEPDATSIKNVNKSKSQSNADLPRSQSRSDHYGRRSRMLALSPRHSRVSPYSTPGRSTFSAATHAQVSKKPRSKHKRFSSSNMPPLIADARIEHLLLAARKIGRERAHTMSGFIRRIEKEKEDFVRERDSERTEREHSDKAAVVRENVYCRNDSVDLSTSPGPSTVSSTPRTPKRGNTGGQHATHFLTPTLMTPRSDLYQPTNPTPTSFVFVRSPVITTYQTSMTPTPRAVNHTISAIHSTTKPTQTPSANHPTPLASLLSAAKSLMDNESSGCKPMANNRRRTAIPEPPESPLSKRRKAGQSNRRGSVDMLSATMTPGSDRVRSALDVLADQAAAAFDSDQQPPARSPGQFSAKNQEKKKRPRTCSNVLSKEEREIESNQKGKATATGSPLITRSQRKGISMDRLSKELTHVPRHRKNDKSAEQQQQNALLPRMIFSPASLPSIPTLSSLSPVSSPMPHTTTSGEDKIPNDLMPSPITDNNCTSPNSAIPQRSVSPSPFIEYYGRNQPDADNEESTRALTVTSNLFSQNTNQAEGEEFVLNDPTMMSVTETGTSLYGESNSGRISESRESTEILDERVGVQSRADRNLVLDEDYHDTDADAEGEMDTDVEETVFMESSSVTHEPLSLALPQSQLGNAHAITMGMIDKEQNLARS